MLIQMKLLTDTVFGNGNSIPGGEDIAVLCDDNGFPYYRGSTFKGIFREELLRLLAWKGVDSSESEQIADRLLGKPGDADDFDGSAQFSDFIIPDSVKKVVWEGTGKSGEKVKECLTHLRTFTAIDETGTAKEGSLRMARCVNKGLSFVGGIDCTPDQKELIKEVLPMIKWVGSMRNRGFGKVEFTVRGE